MKPTTENIKKALVPTQERLNRVKRLIDGMKDTIKDEEVLALFNDELAVEETILHALQALQDDVWQPVREAIEGNHYMVMGGRFDQEIKTDNGSAIRDINILETPVKAFFFDGEWEVPFFKCYTKPTHILLITPMENK